MTQSCWGWRRHQLRPAGAGGNAPGMGRAAGVANPPTSLSVTRATPTSKCCRHSRASSQPILYGSVLAVVAVNERPHLVADGVVVERSGGRVLDAVTMNVRRGAVTALVGPSGAGKTTLLRCLNRLEEPLRGRVVLDGEDVRRLDPRRLRRRVGMVFQAPVLFEGDVRANLAYGLPSAGERALAEALEAAQLPPSFLDRDARRLSVGEGQRVTIARALVREPEALLLDEPTSALDRDAAGGIERLVRRLADERGLTVVMVTHDLEQARRVADHAVLLVDGKVRLAGTPADVGSAWPGVVG